MSFTGDRILVNKFAYQFGEPQRWDVIVFKFPGNAKQNYIKRLVGLPGETIRIRQGDIYTRRGDEDTFVIARKPPRKLLSMLQPVHDTQYIPADLIEAGCPSRWQSVRAQGDGPAAGGWIISADQKTYQLSQPSSESAQWLRYRHVVPTMQDWLAIGAGHKPAELPQRHGELISDFYAYNACIHEGQIHAGYLAPSAQARLSGLHWVGDLALECELEVLGSDGEVWLDLVEGGRHYQCRFDVAEGTATLTIDDGQVPFKGQQGGKAPYALSRKTDLQGAGSYKLRFANADDQLLLWVNGSLVQFEMPHGGPVAAYDGRADVRPHGAPRIRATFLPWGLGARAWR